jgi:hypothetical protein
LEKPPGEKTWSEVLYCMKYREYLEEKKKLPDICPECGGFWIHKTTGKIFKHSCGYQCKNPNYHKKLVKCRYCNGFQLVEPNKIRVYCKQCHKQIRVKRQIKAKYKGLVLCPECGKIFRRYTLKYNRIKCSCGHYIKLPTPGKEIVVK